MKLSEELYHLYDIHDPIKHDTKGLIKGWAIKAGQLEATNTELLEALEFALSELSNMTTTQFSNGADKQARERMTEAIRKAKGE